MEVAHASALIAAAFAGVLPAHLSTCQKNGWPIGQIFIKQTIPTLVSMAVLVTLLGAVIAWASYDKVSWFWLLWILVVSFLGAAIVPVFLRSWSGMIALIVAPLLTMVALFWPILSN